MKIQYLDFSGLDAGNSTISSSEAVLVLKTALFWVITHRIVEISYRRLTLRMGPICCSETYVRNYFTAEAWNHAYVWICVGTVTSLRKVKLVSHFQHGNQSTLVRDLSVFPCEQVDKLCTLSSLPALHFMSVQASAISIDRSEHSYFALLRLSALLFIAFHFLHLSLSLFLSFSFIRLFYHPCILHLIFWLCQSFSLNLSFFVFISIILWHSVLLLLCFHFGDFIIWFGFQLYILLRLIVFS
jgi:hypothetical protein